MIYFQGVSKSFGRHRVLDELDLHIERGKITFIIGKSGEGKSVTIKHIMGLLKPDKGRIIVDGSDIAEFSRDEARSYRRHFGMLFQHAALFDSMTVLDNILFPLREHTMMSTKDMLVRADEVMEQTGVRQLRGQFPGELSTGEKKRVGLARALVAKPSVLLYDEPTTGMDPLISEMIDQLIVEVSQKETGITSIVISHDLKAAMATSDQIVFLYKGKAALSGPPDDFRQSQDPVIRQFFAGKVEGPMEFL
ncbi:MAG: ATP-binding cassette domain-containing protein [Deltaproteobacteria bacterium]|nr:ATP-binding cassette domain-containing protein [Deltaproteobacteria bacterium]